ncbi:lasso peptide biosynthesis PqqD family chaperone [Streptomyces sp. NPDC006530]|uniref:lasso peptide biosynthesis PqqD family chaperone n=1 Tax=Streptomyces sp. NPDC006530 TaxID=3364750 RepID=UPI0036AB6E4A
MALRLAAGISTAHTDYGTVLLNQRSGEYWELNPTGTLVLRTLLEGGDEADAAQAVVAAFDTNLTQATRDVGELTAQLHSSGLVL